MAEILEVTEDLKATEGESFEDIGTPEEPKGQTPEDTTEDLPEKYRGKSTSDLIKMHQEAEKLASRQGNEVGELRTLVDQYINSQTSQAPSSSDPQGEEEQSELDFFENPQEAVSKAIENNPMVKSLVETSEKTAKDQAILAIQEAVPDIQSIMGDSSFLEWVKGSPIRLQQLAMVDQYSVDAAKELFGNWKLHQGVQTSSEAPKAVPPEEDRKAALAKANTGNTSSASTGPRKKIYRRADILKLMREDPKRYEEMSDEILKAYSDGRVR